MKGGAHGSHYCLLTILNLKGGKKNNVHLDENGNRGDWLKNCHIEFLILATANIYVKTSVFTAVNVTDFTSTCLDV